MADNIFLLMRKLWKLLFLISIISIVNITSTAAAVSKSDYINKSTKHYNFHLEYSEDIKNSIEILNDTRVRLIELLHDSLRYRPNIYIFGQQASFEKVVSGKFPDWGAAAAMPYQKTIVIKSPNRFNLNKTLRELLAHEYTHLLVAQKSGLFDPPRWLNEGLAMYVSTEWGWSENLAMSKAAVFGQIISLAEIENLNRFKGDKAQIAYAESYLAVEFLYKNYSKDIFEKFLNQIARGVVIDEALYNVTGLTYSEFESDYKIYLNQRYNFVSLFMDTIFIWLFLALVVIIGFYLKFKKRRTYYKKWEDEEKYHSTDFDYGNPEDPENFEDDDEPWRN